MPESIEPSREVVPVEPRPVEPPTRPRNPLPPIVARTVNICVNCVQGAGRAVREPLRRRYHRHYHARHPHGRKHLIADLAFVAAIVLLIGVNGYLLYGRPRPVVSRVRLDATPTFVAAAAGGPVRIVLTYRYDGVVPLESAVIALRLPPYLTLHGASGGVLDRAIGTITLGTVLPGADRTVDVWGTTLAAAGSTQFLEAVLHGRTSASDERATARVELGIGGIGYTIALADDTSAPPRGELRTELQLTPIAGGTLDAVRLLPRPIPHVDLVVGARVPTQDVDASFEVRIRTDGAPSGTHRVPIAIAVFEDDGSDRILGTIELPVTVRPVSLVLRASREREAPMALGGAETIAIHYDVPAGEQWDHVRLGAVVHGPLMRSSTIAVERGSLVSGAPSWDLGASEKSPGGRRLFQLRLPDRVDAATFSESTEFAYLVTPTAVIATGVDGKPKVLIAGEPLRIPVAGVLRLTAFARYFSPEGDQLGRGPLPPVVGRTTKYWVTWDLRSFIEGSDRLVVRTVLPEGVEWTGRAATTSGEHLAFDPATRAVTWAAGSLERTIGPRLHVATASFEVAFIPRLEHVGKAGVLLAESHAEGIGRVTDIALVSDSPPVTTDLPLDQRVQGRGKVMER